ncbi:uncharacterized protein [Apteryx mantelli]|uniref:Uncharacterized protein n=1 Tax=Apteryx mantelli TaxID=2696672 RepID=A0ABM4E6K5_9AVES
MAKGEDKGPPSPSDDGSVWRMMMASGLTFVIVRMIIVASQEAHKGLRVMAIFIEDVGWSGLQLPSVQLPFLFSLSIPPSTSTFLFISLLLPIPLSGLPFLFFCPSVQLSIPLFLLLSLILFPHPSLLFLSLSLGSCTSFPHSIALPASPSLSFLFLPSVQLPVSLFLSPSFSFHPFFRLSTCLLLSSTPPPLHLSISLYVLLFLSSASHPSVWLLIPLSASPSFSFTSHSPVWPFAPLSRSLSLSCFPHPSFHLCISLSGPLSLCPPPHPSFCLPSLLFHSLFLCPAPHPPLSLPIPLLLHPSFALSSPLSDSLFLSPALHPSFILFPPRPSLWFPIPLFNSPSLFSCLSSSVHLYISLFLSSAPCPSVQSSIHQLGPPSISLSFYHYVWLAVPLSGSPFFFFFHAPVQLSVAIFLSPPSIPAPSLPVSLFLFSSPAPCLFGCLSTLLFHSRLLPGPLSGSPALPLSPSLCLPLRCGDLGSPATATGSDPRFPLRQKIEVRSERN